MEDIFSTLQDKKSSEKLYALSYSDGYLEKLEERFRSLLLLTALEMKEALVEDKRNYREALKSLLNKE